MNNRMEEAWVEYQFDKMVDPAHRYDRDAMAIFEAGWKASQKKNHPAYKQSVWVSVPTPVDDDPEVWLPS